MGTILLVDDNPLRAAMRTSMLEGFEGASPKVVRVSEAAEALCLIEEGHFAEALDVVITVPFGAGTSSISGVEFVSELRSRLARVPVLVLGSGGPVDTEYRGMAGVYVMPSRVPQELRTSVKRLMSKDERRYA